jgi:hypothetical protein
MHEDIFTNGNRSIKGMSICTTTLLGVITKKYPVDDGNCFSMRADDGKTYDVVNFVYENLMEAIKRQKLSLPIQLRIIGEVGTSRTAIMYDKRIPTSWYSNHFCRVCTPVSLLPITQTISYNLDMESGKTSVHGDIIVYGGSGGPDFRTDAEKLADENPIVYSKYIPVIYPS